MGNMGMLIVHNLIQLQLLAIKETTIIKRCDYLKLVVLVLTRRRRWCEVVRVADG